MSYIVKWRIEPLLLTPNPIYISVFLGCMEWYVEHIKYLFLQGAWD